MTHSVRWSFIVGLVLAGMFLSGAAGLTHAGSSAADQVDALLSIGRPGPRAIDLKVWPNRGAGDSYKQGDRFFFEIQADKDAHLAIVAASSDGTVTILFPNQDKTDNALKAKEVYTLYGDDSPIRLNLGIKVKQAQLAFYLASKPFKLEPLKTSGDLGLIQFNVREADKLEALKKQLESITKDEGFNRIMVSLNEKEGPSFSFTVSRVPITEEEGGKALPTEVTSQEPEPMTGVQGRSLKDFKEGETQK